MNVTLRQLRAFLAVARYRHFRRAAEAVHLTQPAISRHIADLEAELEVRLFDRTTREVVPTETGRYLEHALSRTLDDLDAVLAHARQQGDPLRGRVRIAAVPTLSASIMPRCIARCAAEHAEIDILLRDQSQTQVLDAIRGGEVDFGLAIEPSTNEEFDTQTILRDPFWLVCPASHAFAARASVSWKMLRGQPLVLLDHASGSRRLIDHALAEKEIDANVAIEVGHAQTAFRMVAAGLGITVTPGLSLDALTDDLVARRITPVVSREVTLVRRRHRSLSPSADTVWRMLADVAQNIVTRD
ncbi:DNA-binding transcriptional LysR family regulator [Luteibacter rhizovicinus]|uniref:DNA-binding transcriptional LysR family regulator n=1 Tax=Luteibacter rhizovicinus TaxID=242606 RepID=A0A4V2W4J0_9GAMM|nr:LysR family transcriptional regulator [Luteibacter rhizovicinus]TCV96049.1 DNA-binding transcriptional LysR family regulator [Luteibacter rhizovicinus]